ncbi:MAG: 6-phosphofructokinase [Gemmatimonadota bacterium]|nr:MAG: 6-phosphofructokinase [Gemmatimonadota bacterium]
MGARASTGEPKAGGAGAPASRRIAVNTGGGDAPGLNAVIRAVVLAASGRGWDVVGIENGYAGFLADAPGDIRPLTPAAVRGITHLGGTILGSTNRGNPMDWPCELPDGRIERRDRTGEILEAFERLGLDALVAIGGDGSLHIAADLAARGLPVVGVPKTIDNDLAATTLTFGFMTAVETATDAIGRLHSTAESHGRVFVVEVMGAGTGWIALFSGVAATADVILIPEIPYDIDRVCEKILERERSGKRFSMVCVAEGAVPIDGAITMKTVPAGRDRLRKIGGIGARVAQEIADRTGKETRSLVLGHLQRGGPPNAYDRLIALRFGAAAVQCVDDGQFGCMVALDPPHVRAVPLAEALSEIKAVPVDGDVVRTARALGTSFGD